MHRKTKHETTTQPALFSPAALSLCASCRRPLRPGDARQPSLIGDAETCIDCTPGLRPLPPEV